ncbi:MAG: nucleotidyltransferase [Hadesarchaea archaeon]|nr:nucleotidyltransferase [Hadesarchaea archaeon]
MNKVASTLKAVGVPCVVTGGVAVIFYTFPRITYDVDFLVPKLSGTEERRVLSELFKSGFKHTVFMRREKVFRLQDKHGYIIDLITGLTDEILKRSLRHKETGLRVISPEDLIIQKLLSWRLKDRADIVAIISAKREKLDLGYLSKKARKIKKEELLKSMLKKIGREKYRSAAE